MNCKGAFLFEGFLHNLYPFFDIAFAYQDAIACALSNVLFFFKQQLQPGITLGTNDDICWMSGNYLLEDSLLFGDINWSNPFILWHCHYFMGTHEAYCNYIAIHYLKQTAVFICSIYLKKSKCSASFLKVSVVHRTTCRICLNP